VIAANVKRRTALHLAASNGHAASVQLLIAAGAPIEAASHDGPLGQTPLSWAAHCGEIFRQTAETPASRTLRERQTKASDARGAAAAVGRAARGPAVTQVGCVEAVRALLAAGANVNTLSRRRGTPLHIAIERGHDDVANILRESGGVDIAGGS
jgi:ankyrin repeat protein